MELKEIIKTSATSTELVAAVDTFLASQSFSDRRAIVDTFSSITGFWNASQIIAVSMDKFTSLVEMIVGMVIAARQDYSSQVEPAA